jgi:glyceraldehyde 3-phosphate dehydrogenase
VISASADDPDAFLVYGANHDTYDPARHDVVSPGSCGVNALAVMAKVLLDRFGLRSVSTSVVLAIQGWQKVQDSLTGTSRDDPRLGRATGESIIPHNYVVGDLVRVALPRDRRDALQLLLRAHPDRLAGRADRPDRPPGQRRGGQPGDGRGRGRLRCAGCSRTTPTRRSRSTSRTTRRPACSTRPAPRPRADGGVKVRGWFDNEWGFSQPAARPGAPGRGTPAVSAGAPCRWSIV